MVYVSGKRLRLLKQFQKNIGELNESLKYHLNEKQLYCASNKAALIAREIQLQAETIQQYLFPKKEFKADAEVTDDTAPGEISKSIGILQVDDVEEG